MIVDELIYQIRQNLGMTPTREQAAAMDVFARFAVSRTPQSAMIMCGSAGTGKTTLASAIVRTLEQIGRKMMLLAPTGRAAKVFALSSGHEAFTIHRKIYRQRSVDAAGGAFDLNYNRMNYTLFIVDEASMISNRQSESIFGSGRLLDDLLQFVFSGMNCKIMFIGDSAQLPPVGDEQSPALSEETLRAYGLEVSKCELNEVMRQADGSGILTNATVIRRMIENDNPLAALPKVKFSGFPDIEMVTGGELIETLSTSYSRVGIDETIVITRSNKRANIYNQGIRNQVLGREDFLQTGDMLMIVKNNYFWIETNNADSDEQTSEDSDDNTPSFIANGDIAVVRKVRRQRQLYGFDFADVWLTLPDYDDYEVQATIITDALMSDAPALTHEQSEQLYYSVIEDYADIPTREERIKKLREDIHYNALQVKFAYAVTCHKAQGGQWAHVYVDQGYMTDDMLTPDYIHWLYTAFTRATEKLYLVNWPKTQTI